MAAFVAAPRPRWLGLRLSPLGARLQQLMPFKAPPDLSKFLMSPMPGLLVDVAVKEGQPVQAGEKLAVIEAMKMENVLFAAQDGVVGKISAAKGESLAVDQPIGALLEDLDSRGMLDETLVVFATEFGRTPGSQNADGRDHHIFGFSVWMAGGGLKRGVVHGATDEIGFHAVENRHYVTDVHATILKQLGLDSRRLEIPGRKRLEIDHGTPIDDVIA